MRTLQVQTQTIYQGSVLQRIVYTTTFADHLALEYLLTRPLC